MLLNNVILTINETTEDESIKLQYEVIDSFIETFKQEMLREPNKEELINNLISEEVFRDRARVKKQIDLMPLKEKQIKNRERYLALTKRQKESSGLHRTPPRRQVAGAHGKPTPPDKINLNKCGILDSKIPKNGRNLFFPESVQN